ncbi:MAG: hypothetical protein HYZ42_12085, partial [Bacteroidetes bacterium]|nr:hypothetical protein [Bacteroidota bacterium]
KDTLPVIFLSASIDPVQINNAISLPYSKYFDRFDSFDEIIKYIENLS